MKTIGHFNELRRYKQRIRSERMQEILGRVLFIGFVVYLAVQVIGRFA